MLHDLAVVVAQQRGLGLGDDPGRERLLDLAGQVERRDAPGLHALDADRASRAARRLIASTSASCSRPSGIAGLERAIDAGRAARAPRSGSSLLDDLGRAVARRGVGAPAREDHERA